MENEQNPDWVNGLNSAQQQAVIETDGACLILAGAGTGKTRVLTSRLAQILYQQKANPFQILCVTFTNKAAKEMRERVEKHTGAFPGSWIGTFHSLCLKILRKHCGLVGLKNDFVVIDDDDQLRVVKSVMGQLNIDKDRFAPKQILQSIQSFKDDGLTPDMITDTEIANGKIQSIYLAYQDRLQSLNCVDFGDIILYVLEILKNNPTVLKDYQERFKYILVDEYQDTNTAQYQWLKLLSLKNENVNIACVGDDDQSIYGWRGAKVGNILRFEKDFPAPKIIRLEENYRSTGYILKTANSIISHNENRLGKELFTSKGDGEKITINNYYDGKEEASSICLQIEKAVESGEKLSNIAILLRSVRLQSKLFEEKLININMPYKIIGGTKFYEREEIRDGIAYMRLVQQETDDLAFERIINKPTRGIGKTTIQKLQILARSSGVSLYQATENIIQTDELGAKAKLNLKDIIDKFKHWKAVNNAEGHITMIKTLLDESGYIQHWKDSKDPRSDGRIEALKELVAGMEEFENLNGFLEHIALVMDTDGIENEAELTIMTMHSAKGLEFDRVFLAGWEDGLFPSEKSLEETGLTGLEEERRLAYVGITRAKKHCHISWVNNRMIHGQWTNNISSRFLENIPADYVDMGKVMTTTPRIDYNWQNINDEVEIMPPTTCDFSMGERVFHQKFGMGNVINVDGEHITVSFDKAGVKKMMQTFLEKT